MPAGSSAQHHCAAQHTENHLHCRDERGDLVLVFMNVFFISAHACAALLDGDSIGGDGLSIGIGRCENTSALGGIFGCLGSDGGDSLRIDGDQCSVRLGSCLEECESGLSLGEGWKGRGRRALSTPQPEAMSSAFFAI